MKSLSSHSTRPLHHILNFFEWIICATWSVVGDSESWELFIWAFYTDAEYFYLLKIKYKYIHMYTYRYIV